MEALGGFCRPPVTLWVRAVAPERGALLSWPLLIAAVISQAQSKECVWGRGTGRDQLHVKALPAGGRSREGKAGCPAPVRLWAVEKCHKGLAPGWQGTVLG